jgi:acyl carrier protein
MTSLPYEVFAAEIGNILGVPTESLRPEVDIYRDFGIDSLGLVSIGERLERAFSVRIPAADMVTCFELGDFYRVLSALTDEQVRSA